MIHQIEQIKHPAMPDDRCPHGIPFSRECADCTIVDLRYLRVPEVALARKASEHLS